MWVWSQLSASYTRENSELQPRLKKVRRVLVAPPAQTFAKMQTRVLNTCQAFAALKVDPPPSGHAHAYDQRTANWTSPPEGCALPTSAIAPKCPTAADRDCSPRKQSAGVFLAVIPAVRHPSPFLSSTRLPLGVERT
jgi:hypothetical protein